MIKCPSFACSAMRVVTDDVTGVLFGHKHFSSITLDLNESEKAPLQTSCALKLNDIQIGSAT